MNGAMSLLPILSPTNTAKGLSLFAHRIDEQLCNVLLDQLSTSLEEIEGGLSERCKPECRFVVMLIFYTLSFLTSNSEENGVPSSSGAMNTPGMKTMDLTSTTTNHTWLTTLMKRVLGHARTGADTSSRKTWQMVAIAVYILCTYALERSQRIALVQGWNRAAPGSVKHRLARCIHVIDAVAKFADLGNMCWFLYGGMYPHLLFRWGGVHMVPSTSSSGDASAPRSSSSSSGGGVGVVGVGGVGNLPGYSAAQLYVKSRQLLWEVLSGVLAASSLAVDWRRVLVQCRASVVGVAGQAQSVRGAVRSRVLGVVRQVVAVVMACQRRWRQGLRSLPIVGGRFGEVRSDDERRGRSWWDEVEAVESSAEGVDGTSTGATGATTSANGSSESGGRPLFSCAWCGKSPPEAPHQSECGHPFCYLCLRVKVPLTTAPTNTRGSSREGPTRGETREVESEGLSEGMSAAMVFRCPTCQAPATTCRRWSSPPS